MIKTIITPIKNSYNLAIPNNYIGKKIEILFYALDELAEQNTAPKKIKLSDKYRGVFSKEDAKSFNDHTQQMRSEWESI
jgi:hypothetical protein